MDNAFLSEYKNKKVFITGVSGFKGSWFAYFLSMIGADVTGYSLDPPTNPSLFELADIKSKIHFIEGDIRDYDKLYASFKGTKPEFVFHLAAQPIVLESYRNPRYTYETNVMGTVNILECVRLTNCVSSFLNVTTDKVYKNREWCWGYRESEELDGFDPYSNSKSCSELVTHSYRRSFFTDGPAVSTARAGNVIGGGDFSENRIVPDCVRATTDHREIVVRNPFSVRPYQHVLEPLYAYLMIASKQKEDRNLAGYYNVGPEERDCYETGRLVDLFVDAWGDGISWRDAGMKQAVHEANFLKLDCSKIKTKLGWNPRWDLQSAMKATVEWYKTWSLKGNIEQCMESQIRDFLNI
ncbi:CDP-glucose 4,6-dehydratase [Bilifractor sp. LCP21S3_A7]|uniref:CDP-glucose 4,6-dehydratase n=1 Tax=Bilifractor sp. LCP21S3_A7 TaxID=3438738 RepID=UPI003F9290D6